MKPVDFLKALGVAILVMVLDLCCAYGFVSAWVLINHHPLGVTDPKTIELSTLSTRIFGMALLALFVWLFARTRSGQSVWGFALLVFGFYVLVDWSVVGFQGVFAAPALVTAALKLLGTFAGMLLARIKRHA